MLRLVSLFLLTAVAGYSADTNEELLERDDYIEAGCTSKPNKMSLKYILHAEKQEELDEQDEQDEHKIIVKKNTIQKIDSFGAEKTIRKNSQPVPKWTKIKHNRQKLYPYSHLCAVYKIN